MTTPSLYCKKCGKLLAPGASFCKYCGAPLPSAASPSVPPSASPSAHPSARPAPAPPQPAKSNTRSCFLAGLGIMAGACLFLALLTVVLFGLRRLETTSLASIPTPDPPPTSPSAPTSIAPQPTKTHLPPTRTAAAPTARPTHKSSTAVTPSSSPAPQFNDDFTNPGSG